MKKLLFFIPFLLIAFQINAAEIPVTTANFVSSFNAASDGDVLLLASGEYTSSIDFPSGKTITLKAATDEEPIIKFRIQTNNTDVTDGGLIFEDIKIDLGSDYFMNMTIGNISILKFSNCDISNIGRCLLRTSSGSSYTIGSIIYENCVIYDCGTNGWNFMYPSHIVQRLSVTNNTLYNYTNGESFFYAKGSDSNNVFSCIFENNTVYKWAKSSDRALCNTGSNYSASSTYTFNNNIVTTPGVEGTSPKIVSTSAGTVNASNNLIVDYGGYSSPSANQTISDHTLTSLGLNTIGFPDPDNGDFSILATSPIATAGTSGGPIGDPRWIITLSNPAALTTTVSPLEAGSVTPPSGAYESGDEVTVTASRNFGYQFVKWIDGDNNELSTENPYTFNISEDINITAVFEAITTYTLNFSSEGSDWGEVEFSPEPTNGKYETGAIVSVTVVSNPVISFLNWEDNTSSTTRQILMDEDKNISATFDEIPFIVGWDFEEQEPKTSRTADFYSQTSNQGIISMFLPDGSTKNWLANSGSFSPSYPCIRMWTAEADFLTERRYYQANFATTGYENIQLNSLVSGNYQVYSKVKMLYSLDGTNFTELTSVDITDAHNSTWVDCNATLPAEAENQTKVYIRWIGDDTSDIIGSGNDGTALTNIFVFADEIVVDDNDAPLLLSSNPTDGSSTASASGSIVLTFNEKVKAGSGSISFNGEIVTPVFGSKTASFPYNDLDYNTSYSITIPAGAITDMSDNSYAGTTINFTTMNRPQPIAKLYDAVVAIDGSGDYTSVIEAVTNAPTNSGTPYLIFIKNGTYTGHLEIPEDKPNIHLIGQSTSNVIISDDRLCGDKGDGTPVYHVSQGATVVVNSSDCYFENITFENSWGYEEQAGPQALAIYTNNDKIVFNNCNLRSYQDTYLTSTNNVSDRHYLLNCTIEGAVDYIYGAGDVYFDQCTLYNTRESGGYIVAPSHQASTSWGYVFNNCTLDGPNGVITYLGRPWKNAPKTVFLNSIAKIDVYPVGWTNMGTIPAIFADYGTVDENGNALDLSQRKSEYEYDDEGNTITGTAKNSLTAAEAATYTVDNVLSGSDSWNPLAITEQLNAPTNASAAAEFNLSWDANDYAICYVITRDGIVIGFTMDSNYTDATATVGESHTYTIQSANEYGGLSPHSTEIVTDGTDTSTSINDKEFSIELAPNPVSSILRVIASSPVEHVKIYSSQGLLLDTIKNTNSIDMASYASGIYLVEISITNSNKPVIQKIIKQ